jgi:amino acid adenylation domain-containing protein
MLKNLVECFKNFPDKKAFCINNIFFTYSDFAQRISDIRKFIDENINGNVKNVGIATFDEFDTYSSIFAAMFAGVSFVPIDVSHPIERIKSIIEIADVQYMLTCKVDENVKTIIDQIPSLKIIKVQNLSSSKLNLSLPNVEDKDTAYILFTSGSTGIPKGVPLTKKNIESFIDAFFAIGYNIDENDRCLQSSDLTFDLSTMSYMIPLSKGACVYTVPSGGIKYANIYNVLEEHEITIALMVPSVLNYLKPFFNEIRLEKMRYSMFCGEALYADVLSEWSKCVPNALIQNVYGPTEATNFCLTYNWQKEETKNKIFNGIVSIGKPMKNMEAIVVDDFNNPLPKGEKGELCLTGFQLTNGYLKNPGKNKSAFFTLKGNGSQKVFYKTGDIVFLDEDNDFMFCGRKDYQIKIHGYRIELGEIEHHAREILDNLNVVAVAYQNKIGITKIHLFVEKFSGSIQNLNENLKKRLPEYMLPAGISSIDAFPLNVNGKIDRKTLAKLLEEENVLL